MNVIDIIIIGLLLFGAFLGLKRGFTKQLISFLGFFIIVVLAFYLKNYVSVFMYQNLPFIPFGGWLKGITVINIALYEIIAFFLVLAILGLILKLVIFASGLFETILNFTIILGIPSKILGMLVGILEAYVMIFVVLYIASLPIFTIPMLKDSKANKIILNNTPVLSGYIEKSLDVFEEFANLKKEYDGSTNTNEFNLKTLDLFLKYNVITVKSVDKLVAQKKIQIIGIENVLEKYR